MDWIFEKTPLMGGATGTAYTNPLLGRGFSSEGILAREAIQNSCDALVDRSLKVRVVFKRKKLLGESKAEFMSAASFLNGSMSAHKDVLGLQLGNCLSTAHDKDKALPLLYIHDYGTHGLFGEPHDSNSHFFRLLLSLADESKAFQDESSGGSYGFGKSVYSSNSRIRTIIVYSVFDDKYDGVHARLLGCSYFRSHRVEGVSYSGRAWLGVPVSEGIVTPFEDYAAQDFADRLGFDKRRREETGTSILIIDCPVEIDGLRSSIEEWWWPRLIDDELDVELWDQEMKSVPPRPRSRPELRSFIGCYDLASGSSKTTFQTSQKAGEFNRLHNKEVGTYGYAVLPPDLLENDEVQEKVGTVALIRSPKMVVSYMGVGAYGVPAIGVFCASEDIDRYLKLSEPATHDLWDPKSTRLDSYEPLARDFVKSVVDRIRFTLRAFSKSALPPVPESEIRPKFLERLLGNLFRPPTKGTGGGGGGDFDPVSIRFVRQPHIVVDGDKIKMDSDIEVELAPKFEGTFAEVLLEVRCAVVEDEHGSEDDVPVLVECSDVDYEFIIDKPGVMKISLEKDIPACLHITSEPYDPDWTTQLKILVYKNL
jgi:hypothetical protein